MVRALVFSSLLCVCSLGAYAHTESSSILVFGTGRGFVGGQIAIAELQARAPEGRRYEVEEGRGSLSPSEFQEHAVVIISGTEKGGPTWSEDDFKIVLKWLEGGGQLVFLNSSAFHLLGDFKENPHFASLLGATSVSKGQNSDWVSHQWTPPELAGQEEWMSGGIALRGITSAEIICGWNVGRKDAGALIAINKVGKGRVLCIGASPRKKGEGASSGTLDWLLQKFIEGIELSLQPAAVKQWGTEPLGGVAPLAGQGPAPEKRALPAYRKVVELPGEPLLLAGPGVKTIIVLPASPMPSELLAAEEIAAGIRKITNLSVPTASEATLSIAIGSEVVEIRDAKGELYDRAVFVGNVQAGRGLQITADDLPDEGVRYRTEKNLLCIVGKDQSAKGRRLMGTYYAALSVLEEELGVRWLWPGELGEVYPQRESLSIRRCDVTDAPALGQRRLRNAGAVALSGMEPQDPVFRQTGQIEALFKEHKMSNTVKRVAFALSALEESAQEYFDQFASSMAWFRHQRTGGSFRLQYTHAYDDWYERYGADHPEWFALQPNESRKPSVPDRVRLCKANHALTDEIAADTIRKAARDPQADSISISPNDGGADNFFCMCEACRKLDPSNGSLVDFHIKVDGEKRSFRYPSLSDRVVNFYNRIAVKVGESQPDLKLGAYAYSFYRTAPLREALNPNVVIGFVGLTYFDDSRLNRDRESWDQWAKTASSLFLRPNALHLGHGFPGVFVRRMDRDIKHCYETGMIGADFDSVVHHWSTQGLNYYVLAKLLWNPALDVDALVDDYCRSGFGAGASAVRRYFDRLETLTDLAAASVGEEMEEALRDEEVVETRKNPLDSFLKYAPQIYTPSRIAELSALLDEAAVAARGDEKALQRIGFLRLGLEYGSLQSRLYALVIEQRLATPEGRTLFAERQKFFKQLFKENFYAVGLVHIVRREAGLYSIVKKSLGHTD